MRKPKRFLLAHEYEQLLELRNILGITKLALQLDLPFYACRDMVAVQGRVSQRTIQHVRDYLPALVVQHLAPPPAPPAAPNQAVRPLRTEDFEQLRLLRDRVGVTKLAKALDIRFDACRALLRGESVSKRALARVNDNLPQAAADLTTPIDAPAQRPRKRHTVDDDLRATITSLLPFVSQLKLAHALSLSLPTLRAVAAGYRSATSDTIETIRSRLDLLMQPPLDGIRAIQLRPTPPNALSGLRLGLLPPIRGLNEAQTEALLLG